MPRDPRVNSDPAFRERQEAVLQRWTALSSEAQIQFATVTAPPTKSLEDIELWEYARALKALETGLTKGLTWAEIIDLKALKANHQFPLARKMVPDRYHDVLVEIARHHLQRKPASEWLWLLRSQEKSELTLLSQSSITHWSTFWSYVNPHNQLSLKEDIGMALALLSEIAFERFFEIVSTITDSAVLRTIAHWQVENPEFNLALACSEDPLFASLGALNQIEYLIRLEAFGDAAIAALNPYDLELGEVEAVNQTRAEIAEEIRLRLDELFTNLGGGKAHDQLLGELLAYGQVRQFGRISRVYNMMADVAAETVAKRLSECPECEKEIVRGLSVDPVYGMAETSNVASRLNERGAERWSHRLVQHLGSRLLLPLRDALEDPPSSNTDPLAPWFYLVERTYITRCSDALLSLNHTSNFNLVSWFRTQFERLTPLPADRWRYRRYTTWSAGTRRVALLMLIGARLLREVPLQLREDLATLLGTELATRLENWVWFHDVGHWGTSALSLEHAAVRKLAQALEPADLSKCYEVANNVWILLAVAEPHRESEIFATLTERLDISLATDLHFIDAILLSDVIGHIITIEHWDALELALQRYRLLVGQHFLEEFKVLVWESHLLIGQHDVELGTRRLQEICKRLEQYIGRKDHPMLVEIYLNALQKRSLVQADDANLAKKVASVSTWLELVSPEQ